MLRSSQSPTSLCRLFGAVLHRRQPALAPAGDATRQKPIRAAEVVQPDRLGIHRMDRGDRFQQAPGTAARRSPAGAPVPAGRCSRITRPGPVFDDLKALADDRGIVAQMQPARDERQRVRQARQDAELARHVVGAGGQFPHRRAAQHGGFAVQVDQIVQVGQAAGELARRRVGVQAMAVRRQIGADRIPVQGDAVGGGPQAGFGWHASSCSLLPVTQYSSKRMTQPNVLSPVLLLSPDHTATNA